MTPPKMHLTAHSLRLLMLLIGGWPAFGDTLLIVHEGEQWTPIP